MNQILHCPQCNTPNPVGASFCIECGAAQSAASAQATTGPTVKLQTKPCPSCSVLNPVNARICVACERDMTQPKQPAYRSPQPTYPPPQPRIYPRVQQPPVYAPQSRSQRQQPRGHEVQSVLLAVGVMFLLITSMSNHGQLPFFVFFLPLGLLPQLLRGRSTRKYAPLFWMLGLLFLFATGTLWPGLLILWIAWMVLGR